MTLKEIAVKYDFLNSSLVELANAVDSLQKSDSFEKWIDDFLEVTVGDKKEEYYRKLSMERLENIYNDLCNWRKQFNS